MNRQYLSIILYLLIVSISFSQDNSSNKKDSPSTPSEKEKKNNITKSIRTVDFYLDKAKQLQSLNDDINAIVYLDSAYLCSSKTNDSLTMSYCLYKIGLCYKDVYDYYKSIQYLEKAIFLIDENKNPELFTSLSVYLSMVGLHDLKNPQKTDYYVKKTITVYNQTNSKNKIIRFLSELMNMSSSEGYSDKAFIYGSMLLNNYASILSQKDLIEYNIKVGLFAMLSSNQDKSMEFLNKAYDISVSIGNLESTIKSLLSFAVYYAYSNRYLKCLEYILNTITLLDRTSSSEIKIIVYYELMRLYSMFGNTVEVINCSNVLKDECMRKSDYASLCNCEILLGNLYITNKNFELANLHFNDAYTSYLKSPSDSILRMKILLNQGYCDYKTGNYNIAEDKFNIVLDFCFRSIGIGTDMTEMPKSMLYKNIDKKDKFELYMLAYNHLGELYREKKKYDNAEIFFSKAVNLADKFNIPFVNALLYYNYGYNYFLMNNIDYADKFINKSINYFLEIKPDFKNEESRFFYSELSSNAFCGYLDVLYSKNKKLDFIKYSELSSANSLIELLGQSKLSIEEFADSVLLKQMSDNQKEIKICNSLLINTKNSDNYKFLQNKLDSLYSSSLILKENIKRSSPLYSTIKYPEPIDLKNIQSLIDDSTAVLSFKQGISYFYLIMIKKADYSVFKLGESDKIIKLIDDLRPYIVTNKMQTSSKAYSLSRELYDITIKNVILKFDDIKKLVIIPDGPFYYLPFEYLLTRDLSNEELRLASDGDFSRLPYFIKNYDIRYLPSATMIKILGLFNNPTTSKEFLCVADPVFASENLSEKNNKSDNNIMNNKMRIGKNYKDLERLPETGVEADSIVKLFNQSKVKLLKRNEATEENLNKINLSEYKYIHFATHGIIDNQRPQFSKLALSIDLSSEEDGFLEAWEIMALKLNAEMVVLSACETGLGKEVRGEGIIGLPRAFFVAGAKNVVVSLWSVNDESTKELMIEFYKGILAGKTKSQALRDAKLFLIAGKRFSSPYYWAPFVLFGNN